MKKIIILYFLFSTNLLFCQNLITNPSFEDGINNICSPNKPLIFGQMGSCLNWVSLGTLKPICTSSCKAVQEGSSPDWYKNVPGGFAINGIQGSSGSGYVGAALTEMIQQNLSNTLTKGRRYRVKMKVRIPPTPLTFNTTSLFPFVTGTTCVASPPTIIVATPKSTTINILTSSSKIDYIDNNTSADKIGGITSKFNIPIPPSATDGWVEILGDIFVGLTETVNFIAFEPNRQSTVLIDDVSLELIPIAQCPCGAESSAINLSLGNNPSAGSPPLFVNNTSNLSSIRVRVFSFQAFTQNAIRTIQVDHPRCIVEWDGFDDLGNPLPSAPYQIEVLARNDCEEKLVQFTVFVDIVPNLNNRISTFPSFPNKVDLSSTCCVPNIDLNKNTFLASSCTISKFGVTAGVFGSMLGTFNVIASKSIKISDNVSFFQSNITFTAPSITVSSTQLLPPGVKIIPGNSICPVRPFGLTNDGGGLVSYRESPNTGNVLKNEGKTNLNNEALLQGTISTSSAEENNINFNAYPNPHSESFVINNNVNDLTFIGMTWEIFDARGIMHKKGILSENETKITTIGMPIGLYFIKINTPYKSHILRVIKE